MMHSRIESILDYLFQMKEPITGEQLAQLIQVSPRTIVKDLQTIKELLSESGCTLVSKRGTGYYLEATENEKYELRKKFGIYGNKSSNRQLRLLSIMDAVFLADKAVTLSAFAAELNVNKSCIMSDIQAINAYIRRYQVCLEVKRNAGVTFSGIELAIRYSYLSFRKNNAEYISIPIESEQSEDYMKLLKYVSADFSKLYLRVFPTLSIGTIIDSVVLAEEKLGVSFTESSWENILQYLALAILRPECMPPFMGSASKSKIDLAASVEFTAAKRVAAYLLRKAGSYISENEVYYLSLCMQANARQDSVEDIMSRTEHLDSRTMESAHALLQYFSELLKYQLDKDALAELLSYYIERMRIKNSSGLEWFAAQPCPALVKNNDVLVACLSSHNVVESLLGFEVDNSDLFHIAICLDNAMIKSPDNINAVYISREDYSIARQQVNQIQSSLPGIKFLKVIQSSKLGKDEKRRYLSDPSVLVCSTFPLQVGVPLSHQVVVSSRFNDDDAYALKLEMYKMRKGSPRHADGKDAPRPHIIANTKNYRDEKEILHSGCVTLRRMGYAYQGYEADVFCKEMTQPSTLENGVAIPHASPQYVKESAVYLMRLDTPVIWSNGESVDLVFFLAFRRDNGELIRQNASWVYSLLNNPATLSALRAARDSDELMNILRVI